MNTEEHGNAARKVEADVRHRALDSRRDSQDLPVSLGGQTLPERLLRRHADDLVCPCCVDVCDSRTAQGGDDEHLAGEVGESATEEGGDEREENGVGEVEAQAAEAGPAAGVGDEVLDCAADGGGDGLLVDEGDGGSGLQEAFLLFFVCGLVRGYGDGCDRGLDHAECGDDFVEHVGYL